MSNISTKITNALKFLREFYKDASNIYEDCYDKMLSIDNINENTDNYQNELRKETVKFKEDMEDLIKEIDVDYDLFIRDYPDIKSNRYSDDVVYSLREFLEYYDLYKKLEKKKYNILILKLETRMDVSSSSKDYGRYIAYNKIIVILNKILSKVETVKKKCGDLTNEKNKDEE